MAYQRFLINKDYDISLSKEQFKMLVQDNETRIIQAEQRAEMRFMEYLDQHYDIEKVFFVGKAIRPYKAGVTYPANSFYKTEDGIVKVVKSINGCKKPTSVTYWELIEDFNDMEALSKSPIYCQLHTYSVGDIVKYMTEYYRCLVPNGYDFDNIQIPGVQSWAEVETTAWQPNIDWQLHQVCSYNNNFYTLTKSLESTELVLSPEECESWGMIGNYTSDYNYTIGNNDYVVCEGKVFEPIANVNADKPVMGENIEMDDPRNLNVVEHMVTLATYYLHEMISPTNIPTARQLAYENSIQWLSNASRFKINPKIPRKMDEDTGKDSVTYAVGSYQKTFDPYENMWII